MPNNTWCVYCHRNKINGKSYIGQSKTKPSYRWGVNGKNYKSSTHFYRAIQKYGWDNFEHFIIFENLSLEKANELEYLLIKIFDTSNLDLGYNIRQGGKSSPIAEETKEKLRQANLGKVASEETREKISKAMTGKNNPFYNKEHTEEARERMKNNHRDVSGENNPMYGKHHDNETKRKISEKRIGSHMDLTIREKISKPVLCIDTGISYYSIKEASRQTGICESSIIDCCKGKLKTAGKLHWKYIIEDLRS